jgi:UDP-N-acetylglucosamine/UDP-N-acetylgalactosamine diphosphorylase
MNPDGHGGTFKALHKSGSLDSMRGHGIEEIFYYQIDNPLVKVCDPLFLGLHHLNNAQMSSKVVRKTSYEEKVGVMVKMNNKTTLLEYSDMDAATRYATFPDGEMLHWGGNSAIHVIRRDFAEEITKSPYTLPFHRALKKILTRGEDGRPVEIEGIKFEMFLFDALPLAQKAISLEVLRKEEFAPVKNRTGVDSLETSAMMQSALHASWLEKTGHRVEKGIHVEISPLYALDEEDLKLKVSELPNLINCNTYLG